MFKKDKLESIYFIVWANQTRIDTKTHRNANVLSVLMFVFNYHNYSSL